MSRLSSKDVERTPTGDEAVSPPLTAPGGSPKEGTDESRRVIERCLRGDERAFAELHRAHAAGVYRHLLALLGSAADAEDATQLVFLQAHRSLHLFAGRSSVSTWLHGIAVKVALNARRSRRRAIGLLERFGLVAREVRASPRVEEAASAKQEIGQVYAALDHVAPKRAVAFALYYFEQLDLASVARLLGCSENTAWARIERGRTAMLEVMNRPGKRTEHSGRP